MHLKLKGTGQKPSSTPQTGSVHISELSTCPNSSAHKNALKVLLTELHGGSHCICPTTELPLLHIYTPASSGVLTEVRKI